MEDGFLNLNNCCDFRKFQTKTNDYYDLIKYYFCVNVTIKIIFIVKIVLCIIKRCKKPNKKSIL